MEKILKNTKYRRNYFTSQELIPFYDALVDAISKKKNFLEIGDLLNDVKAVDISNAFENVFLDNPQFYYCFKNTLVFIQNNRLNLNYQNEFTVKEEQNIEQIIEYLETKTKGMDEYNTALFAFEFLTRFCVYDSRALEKDLSEKYEKLYSSFTLRGALIDRVACCNGVASAYLYILYKLGIDSYIARASLPSPNSSERLEHVYNVVIINGVKVNVDITLSMKEKNRFFSKENRNVYYTTHIGFGVSDKDLINMGYRLYQDQVVDIPIDANENFSYYMKNNLIFDDFPALRNAMFSMCNRHKMFECRYDGHFDNQKLNENISRIKTIVSCGGILNQYGRFVILIGGELYEN